MLISRDEIYERINNNVSEILSGMVRYSKEHDLGAVLMCGDQFKGLIDGAYCFGELNYYDSSDLRHFVNDTRDRIWEEYNS